MGVMPLFLYRLLFSDDVIQRLLTETYEAKDADGSDCVEFSLDEVCRCFLLLYFLFIVIN